MCCVLRAIVASKEGTICCWAGEGADIPLQKKIARVGCVGCVGYLRYVGMRWLPSVCWHALVALVVLVSWLLG